MDDPKSQFRSSSTHYYSKSNSNRNLKGWIKEEEKLCIKHIGKYSFNVSRSKSLTSAIEPMISSTTQFTRFLSKDFFQTYCPKKFGAALDVLLSSPRAFRPSPGECWCSLPPSHNTQVSTFSALFSLTRPLVLQLQKHIFGATVCFRPPLWSIGKI